jgi:hypothetical protein
MSHPTLGYETPRPARPARERAGAVLGGSGLLLAGISWLLILHTVHGEPFMVYDPADAAAFFVLGTLLVVLWIGWAVALTRLTLRRLLPPLSLLALPLPAAWLYLIGLAIRQYEAYLPDFLGV